MRRLVVAAATVAALVTAGPASAVDATAEQVRELAREAIGDAEAELRLRRIDSVDGRPADLERALAGADTDEELDARLRALAQVRSPAARAERDARAEARDILAQRRYRGSDVPRPFRRPLRWLGGKLEAAAGPFVAAIEWLPDWLAIALGLAVAAAAALGVVGVVRARSERAVVRHRTEQAAREEDPGQLERLAHEAEQRGELERALRLRFRAGLVRLVRARAVPARASLTTGQILRLVRVPELERIAFAFEEVAYGGRPAKPEDVADARATWPLVVAAATRRA